MQDSLHEARFLSIIMRIGTNGEYFFQNIKIRKFLQNAW